MIIGISGKINSGKDLIGKIIKYLDWRNDLKYIDTLPEISEKHFNEYKHSLVIERSNWKIVKFADKLKDIVCLLIGCTREQLEDEDFKNTKLGNEWNNTYDNVYYTNLLSETYTPRQLLQYIGTDLFRNRINQNIWINATMNEYKSVNNPIHYEGAEKSPDYEEVLPNWIITDVRFHNEVKAIEDKGGFVIRINRSTTNRYNSTGDINKFKSFNHASEILLDNHDFKYTINNDTNDITKLILNVKEILVKENII